MDRTVEAPIQPRIPDIMTKESMIWWMINAERELSGRVSMMCTIPLQCSQPPGEPCGCSGQLGRPRKDRIEMSDHRDPECGPLLCWLKTVSPCDLLLLSPEESIEIRLPRSAESSGDVGRCRAPLERMRVTAPNRCESDVGSACCCCWVTE
ncbi:hypothetical protein BC828DRAFT_66481 [Blastocladiella britannica]|nr:hypothetical protein BC828DRAFT_66481 [Blastocladiella britannica]